MTMVEDAASVLEQFVQDVSNLPAEIHHLLEEIQDKDHSIQKCRSKIADHDTSIQKFLKQNSTGKPNPKEAEDSKIVMSNFDKARVLQEDKVTLSEKATVLLDRQIKNLDFKIRDLQNEGSIAPDPQLPSLLNNNNLHNTRLPPLSTSTTAGGSTPLTQLSGNAGPSTTIANNPITRLVQPNSARQPSPLNTAVPGPNAASGLLNPARGGGAANRSPSTDPAKRRRLNPHHLSIPATSSNLRQSSLGPGTPKGGDISRQSSAGPSRPSNKSKPRGTGPPHQRIGHLNPAANKKGGAARRRGGGGGGHKKSGTPASQEEDSVVGDDEDQDVEMEDGDEEGEGDDKKYCICHSVSYGNMVACDNDDCPNEWFHWSCVGVNKEPAGKWYCPDCSRERERNRR